MALIGYARVSTDEQLTRAQLDELRAAGCAEIFEERASGGSRTRPELARALLRVTRGDTLLVMRLDRLARSLSHLLEVIEALGERGAHFRSLHDPIDTSTVQGKFALHVLGAAAELERGLIRERTIAGLSAARARGRVGGNPGLRSRQPEAVRKVARSRDAAYLADLNRTAPVWLPIVRRMRPDRPWHEVLRAVNTAMPGPGWTIERLVRAVKRFVREGFADKRLLEKAPARSADDRLMLIVAGLVRANPKLTLRQIGAELQAMRAKTPAGRSAWAASSVKNVLDRAHRLGLLADVKR